MKAQVPEIQSDLISKRKIHYLFQSCQLMSPAHFIKVRLMKIIYSTVSSLLFKGQSSFNHLFQQATTLNSK